MLYLFNKVYIANDSAIDINLDRVVISEKYGIQMYGALDQIVSGELIAYGKSLEDILTNLSYETFISNLNVHANETNKKIVIYADDINFSKFMAIWFKSILKSPTANSSWNILNSYIEKEKIMKNWRYASSSTNSAIFLLVTKENFTRHFNSIETAYSLNVDNLSFESLLATYLSSGEKKEDFKNALTNILNRSMQELVLEIKHTYIKNYKKINFIDLDVDIDFFTKSSLYPNEHLGRVSTQSVVNIAGASQEDIDKFKLVATKILTEWEQFKTTSSIVSRISLIDYVRTELTDEQLNYLIDFEKTNLSATRLYSSSDEEKINVYHLDFILNSNTEDLVPYILK
jgi:hypothetical protein